MRGSADLPIEDRARALFGRNPAARVNHTELTGMLSRIGLDMELYGVIDRDTHRELARLLARLDEERRHG